MPSSMYEESILNGIASGLSTRMDLSTELNISYFTVSKIISNLISNSSIKEFKSNNEASSILMLTKKERNRLYNFVYVPIIVEDEANYMHEIDDAELIFSVQNINIYSMYSDIIQKDAMIIKSDKNREYIFDIIDNNPNFSKSLPILCIDNRSEINRSICNDIIIYRSYQFPIFITHPLEALYEPPKSELKKFENPTAEKIFCVFKPNKEYTIHELASIMKLSSETIRKNLSVLVHQKRVKKRIDAKFADTVFYI